MKKMRVSPFISAFLILIFFTSSAASPAGKAPDPPSEYIYHWTDSFDTANLHQMWSWENEDNTHWSLTDSVGDLRILTQEGGVYGGSNSQKNILVSEGPVGDSQITTRVGISPTENFQYAGIHYFVDDDNYIQLNYAYANHLFFQMDREIDGVPYTIQIEAPELSTVYLRIVRQGLNYSGYYSEDGSGWTLVGGLIADLGTPKVGLLAANGLSGPAEIPADFDYFRLDGTFYWYYQDTFDGFTTSTLGPSWSWINENNLAWSLTANPSYLRILTDDDPVGGQNLLYQSVPLGDFAFSTRLLFAPTANYQFAGLILGQDENNGMKLGRAFCSEAPPFCTNGNGIYFDYTAGGVFQGNFATAVPEATTTNLYIEHIGDVFSGYYNGDSTTWRLIGRYNTGGNFHPSMMGLTAAQDLSNLQLPADFAQFIFGSNLGIYLPVIRH